MSARYNDIVKQLRYCVIGHDDLLVITAPPYPPPLSSLPPTSGIWAQLHVDS